MKGRRSGGREGGEQSLRARAMRGTGWQFTAKLSRLVLELGVLAILSRLVSPAEFGRVAIAMIFITVSALFYELGVRAAIVQRRNLTDEVVRTAFTISVVSGVSFCLLLGLAAPWVSAFFRADVTWVLRALSLNFVFIGFGLTAKGLLQRTMNFRALALTEIVGYSLGYGAVGVTLAYHGFGVWALVAGLVSRSFLGSLIANLCARHPKAPYLGRAELKQIFSYSVGVTLTRVFNELAKKGDYFVTGRWLGPAALGFYQRAFSTADMPAAFFTGVIGEVSFPAMAEVQDNRERLRRIYLRNVALVAAVYLPLSAVLFLAGPLVIRVLFGPDWDASVPPFRILCVGMIFMASYPISDGLIKAKGESAVWRSALRVALYALLVVGGAYVGQRWGVEGVAAAVLLAVLAKYLLVAHLCLAVLEARWRDYLRCQLPGLVIALFVAGGLAAVTPLLGRLAWPAWAELLVIGAVAAALVLVLLFTLPPAWIGEDLYWAAELVRERLPLRVGLVEAVLARYRPASSAPGEPADFGPAEAERKR